MIILENPYVSEYLIETIKKNKFSVLDNEISRQYFSDRELTSTADAIEILKEEPLYSNSENSIDWVFENLKNSDILSMIQLSKDKISFRKMLSSIYPDYYFREVSIDEIQNIDVKTLKFPFVLKPSVGFLSFGVYPVKNEKEFDEVISRLKLDIEKLKGVFPLSVVDCTNFLIEEMIEGDEYAIDAYFDEKGEATILNIFQHPFYDENDVSDRIYFTSKDIIKKYLKPFKSLLDKIGAAGNYKNFPFHLELRANENKIIPIEINPMRFCGWCITDIAQNAWGINVYEYFMNNKKPCWDEILNKSSDDYYYFTIGDIPSSVDKKDIKKIDYDKYLKNITNPLVIRKIDYMTKPVFAIVFATCKSKEEIRNILKLNMLDFIELEKR